MGQNEHDLQSYNAAGPAASPGAGRAAPKARETGKGAEQQNLTIEICMGSSCFARGNNEALPLMQDYLAQRGLEDRVRLVGHLCADCCSRGPLLTVNGRVYEGLTPEATLELVTHACREHLE
jgi:NADH:ubiquinone oxidoreductase subunit E